MNDRSFSSKQRRWRETFTLKVADFSLLFSYTERDDPSFRFCCLPLYWLPPNKTRLLKYKSHRNHFSDIQLWSTCSSSPRSLYKLKISIKYLYMKCYSRLCSSCTSSALRWNIRFSLSSHSSGVKSFNQLIWLCRSETRVCCDAIFSRMKNSDDIAYLTNYRSEKLIETLGWKWSCD